LEKIKKKWYKKWWVWVIIIIVIGAIGANMDSSEEATNQTNDGSNNSTNTTETKPVVAESQKEESTDTTENNERAITKVGDTIQTKNFKVTVENLEKVKSDNEFLQPEDGKEFVSVGMLIENISEKDYSVSSILMFSAYQDGFSINEDLSAHASKGGTTTLNGDLAAGKKIRGNLMYQLPKEWKELEIDVDLTALSLFSDDGEIKIKLQNQ
jgi:hypothetical protein